MLGNPIRRAIVWISAHRQTVILAGILGVAMSVFVAGGIVTGLFLLSQPEESAEAPTPVPSSDAIADVSTTVVPTTIVVDQGSEEHAVVPTRQPADPRFAMLLLGYGGPGHDGPYLTDSMMVVIVDPAQRTLTLFSLPRDAWVPIVFDGQKAVYSKLNTAYALAKDSGLYRNRLPRYQGDQGAGLLATDTVARILGIPISYYLALDFAGFREMINIVGGVDVEVPATFSSLYPVNDNPYIDSSWMVVRFQKGLEHMTGERAIQFARARETLDNSNEGSDFARSRRQRLIMEAFKTKLLQPEGLIHLPQLIASAGSHVDTNYDLPSVTQFSQIALDWTNVRFYEAALTNANYLTESTGPEGAYILVPNSGNYSWSSVMAVARRLWETPEVGTAMVNTQIVVENDSGLAGLGSRVSDTLEKLGYRVGAPSSGPTNTRSRVVDRTAGKSSALLRQLESDLRLSLETTSADKGRDGADVTLQIGSDGASLADLVLPQDSSAPSSGVGLARYGSWSPQPIAPPAPRAPVAPRAPTATPQSREQPEDASSGTITPRQTPARGTAVPRQGTPGGTTAPGQLPANGTPAPGQDEPNNEEQPEQGRSNGATPQPEAPRATALPRQAPTGATAPPARPSGAPAPPLQTTPAGPVPPTPVPAGGSMPAQTPVPPPAPAGPTPAQAPPPTAQPNAAAPQSPTQAPR